MYAASSTYISLPSHTRFRIMLFVSILNLPCLTAGDTSEEIKIITLAAKKILMVRSMMLTNPFRSLFVIDVLFELIRDSLASSWRAATFGQ